MIDTKALLDNFDAVAQQLRIKNIDESLLKTLYELSIRYKQSKQHLESLQAFQNKNSKIFGSLRAKGEDTTALKTELDSNKQEILKAQRELEIAQSLLTDISYKLPNLPDSNTPKGQSEEYNQEIAKILKPRNFHFAPKEHWELAEQNGWIDFEAGVKLAKSRFSVLRGMGAKLNRALINFMLDYNQNAGFEVVVTPVIANAKCLFGTGQLPKFEDDMFKLASTESEGSEACNELYLISTSEITLTNLYNDMIIPESELPIMLTTHTPCFRKEAGSAGRDTRGMFRQHQFDKVELVAITRPQDSDLMQEKMLQTASGILRELELPHRFVQLCGGDLGFSASNTIDIEVWLPAQARYREVSSVSNTRDFQARRAKIRYKDGNKNTLVHTLNGSSLAVGRTLIALMENYQNPDGSISIPKILEKYL
ncbi:serine--tRNA ligase [Helicobacter sp. 10-6591]|uniref:serine--tRNA ligase n=1 Tax=Helicobacter sp. 10-6591 TaxID=2004998 RepID=UPI000DCDA3EB|nr:serine--tRNA ligase [Helicobacter sp. 10-6591]RAX55935.1 serine--tRNA ligase [Helicobacter sp. 10-6591]